MALTKWIRDLVASYSFVDRVEYRRGYMYVYYMSEGNEKYKRLAYRATKDQLMNFIDSIKDEVGYAEIKKEHEEKIKKELKKPLIFMNN